MTIYGCWTDAFYDRSLYDVLETLGRRSDRKTLSLEEKRGGVDFARIRQVRQKKKPPFESTKQSNASLVLNVVQGVTNGGSKPLEMDDAGDPEGWPLEGFCLVVTSDGKAKASWLCKGRPKDKRTRVLVYGEASGKARYISSDEHVEAYPRTDVDLARRLQRDWNHSAPAARDAALCGMDEVEARRAAPGSFIAMVTQLRTAAVIGETVELLGPSASIGREFYPNLFPPLVGDTVRVLYEGGTWYESTIVQRRSTDTRQGDPVARRAATGAVVACEASYFSSSGSGTLRVRYLSDGAHENLKWPDPNDEAFLLAQPPLKQQNSGTKAICLPRRRCSPRQTDALVLPRDWRPFLAKDRSGSFENPASSAIFAQSIDLGRRPRQGRPSSPSFGVVTHSETALDDDEDMVPAVETTPQQEDVVMIDDDPLGGLAPGMASGDSLENDMVPLYQRQASRGFAEATSEFFLQGGKAQEQEEPAEKKKKSRRQRRRDLERDLGPVALAAVRCCLWLRALARPLSALIDDFGQLKSPNAPDLAFDSKTPRCDDDDWPFEAPALQGSPIAALTDLADALSKVLPLAALPAAFHGIKPRNGLRRTSSWLRRPDHRVAADAHVALFESRIQRSSDQVTGETVTAYPSRRRHQDNDEEFTELVEQLAVDLKVAAATVADGWDRSTRTRTLGPGNVLAAGAPCFTTLPQSRVHEPHRSWIRRARHMARERKKRDEEDSDPSEEDDDDEEEGGGDNEEDDQDSDEAQRPAKRQKKKKAPRRYRPPGAAARKAMCGGDELSMETVATEITTSLAGGLGSDCGPRVEVVNINEGVMKGEREVVAARDLDRRAVIPYAGVVVTDDELARLLWREPRAVANWLMYRYEFAPQISVLPYLNAPSFAPAPFINCARGPHPTDLFVWQSFTSRHGTNSGITTPQKKKKKKQQRRHRSMDLDDDDVSEDDSSSDEDEPEDDKEHILIRLFTEDNAGKSRWRCWGSEHIGLRVRREINPSPRKSEDSPLSAGGSTSVDGTVVGWLDKDESDFIDDQGYPGALYRVKYDPGSVLAGDFEDLELHELLASAKAPSAPNLVKTKKTLNLPVVSSTSSDDSSEAPRMTANSAVGSAKKANCHFEEVVVDGAVLGVYVVASRKVTAGEQLLVTYGREFWSGWVQRRARLADLDVCADQLASAARAVANAVDRHGSSTLLRAVEARKKEFTETEPKLGRHDRWRRVMGVPFEAQRAVRGERGRAGVVVGLAIEAPASAADTKNSGGTTSFFAVGDRVEGYWRGSAPSFPATVVAVDDATNQLHVSFDDGHDEITTPAYVRPYKSPQQWRDLPHVPIGTWVRQFDEAPPVKGQRSRRREGVVVKVHPENHRLDVLGDDNVLDPDQAPDDWEPLFVTRFAEDHEQRTMGLDQLLHMQPLFLDALKRRPLFSSFHDADSALRQRYNDLATASPPGLDNLLSLALLPRQPQVRIFVSFFSYFSSGRRRPCPRHRRRSPPACRRTADLRVKDLRLTLVAFGLLEFRSLLLFIGTVPLWSARRTPSSRRVVVRRPFCSHCTSDVRYRLFYRTPFELSSLLVEDNLLSLSSKSYFPPRLPLLAIMAWRRIFFELVVKNC